MIDWCLTAICTKCVEVKRVWRLIMANDTPKQHNNWLYITKLYIVLYIGNIVLLCVDAVYRHALDITTQSVSETTPIEAQWEHLVSR